jgi:predicted metal-dependent HD superfamily phosphohydrolase
MMRSAEAYAHITHRLRTELEPGLSYHSLWHTLDVAESAERLATAEGVAGEERELLVTAAYYHDAGFLKKYFANEAVGADIVRRTLPEFGYSREQIKRVEQLILATALPHRPDDLLEQLIIDADMDYLGRDDYWRISTELRRELITHGKAWSLPDWLALQVRFLTDHRYFTATAQRERGPGKAGHLQQLHSLVGETKPSPR